MTSQFTTSITDQVKLNLIHYNLWTEVEVHNDHILKGLPPQKLVSSDDENKQEWIVCKRLLNTKLSVVEINSWFKEIQNIINGNGSASNGTSQRDDEEEEEEEKDKQEDISTSKDKNGTEIKDGKLWKNVQRNNGENRVDRITIAMINDDGTIVYYFLYDGITKPRQN
ncbi:SEN15 [Candida oxycetoniae]|uniref:SEN15 n=1 Tax=Candida oxycetoniae TaxID=497107 RepID=A0AAI9WZR5_9ASCO|nr:SEN15 [Candida oxycetoniae]KAI3406339.2 SEN15 [Candida oxycetoniae]